jgi:hypothetical protein
MKSNSGFSQLPNGLWVPQTQRQEALLDAAERAGIPRRVAIANAIKATLAGDSIVVTPGTGATVATHTVNSKEHQVVMIADADGHIHDSRPEYMAWFTPQTNAASREWAELWNGDAAVIVRVRGIWIVPTVTAITGVNIGADVNKINTAPTGGTAITPRPLDSNFPALDADIVCTHGSTGGAALDHLLFATYHFNEETNASLALLQHQNLIPSSIGDRVAEIVVRPSQGIQVKQHAAGTVGLTGVLMYFVVDN